MARAWTHSRSLVFPADVEAINRSHGAALLEDGQTLPITDWFDSAGNLTDKREEAVSCIAGPAADGRWYAIDLNLFRSVRSH